MSETIQNFSFEVADTATKKYQLDVSELYDYPAMTAIQPLQTCPLTSEIKQVEAPWSSGNQFVFDTNFGKTQFISNCFKFHFTIPLTVTLASGSASSADITESNFMTNLFAGQNDITYSQYSFMQAIQTLGIDINNRNIANLQNVSETINQIAPYYNRGEIDEWFHSSQPDRYQSFNDYTATAMQKVEFINQHNEKAVTSVGVINESNIFESTYQKGYNSRAPQWTWVGPGADPKRSANLKASFWVYLPLSFGSVPSEMTAFSGINRLAFTFGLKADLGSWLFNIKQAAGVYRYSDISLNTVNIAERATAQMICQVYSAPQYMRDKMVSPTGLMQPYSISYPRILTTTGNTQSIAAGSTKDFNISNVQSGVVPRSIYIALQKVKKGDFQSCSTTPINYGLITNLSLRIESAHTNFPSVLSLDHLTNSNGYDELDSVGKLIKGFPIKIDLGKDISLPGDMVVGQTYPFTFEVLGNVRNQGAVTADYKLLVTVVTDATLDFDGVDFQPSSGVLVDNSVLNDKHFLKDQYSLYQRKINVMGGGMFTNGLKWLGRNALSLAKSAWENRDRIAKTVNDVVGLVKAVRGGAHGGRMVQSNVSGGAARGTRTMGAGQVRETVFK